MNAKRLRKMKAKLERAGGSVHISDDLPDDLAEIFLNELLSCPGCAAAMAKAERPGQRRRSGH